MATAVDTNNMILSKKTHEILKNFATINPNICITSGSKIVTLSPTKNIMAEAEVDEEFTHDVRIYDLNQFLSTVSMFQSPELELHEDHLIVSGSNGSRAKCWYSDPAIVQPVTQKLTMPDILATVNLSANRLQEILKASAVMRLPNLKIVGEDGVVTAILYDRNDPSSNEYTVSLDGDTDETFSVSFKVDTLKLIPGDYTLEISKKIVSRFTHATESLKYYIAMEFKTDSE